MNSLNDYELLYLLEESDEEAQRLLVEKYKGFIEKIIYRTLAACATRLSDEEFHELVLTCTKTLIDAAGTYREENNVAFSFFAGMCIKSHVRTYLRNRRSYSNYMFSTCVSLDSLINEEDGSYLMELVKDTQKTFDPKRQFEIKEAKEKVNKTSAQLSEEERRIWNLWMHGYSYKEIGDMCNHTVKHIGYVLYKVKKILAGIID